MDRNETMKAIKKALERRSGKTWSVTGGRGTAWGWITIDAPPKRRTGRFIEKSGASPGAYDHEKYELTDTGEPGGYITPQDRAELTRLLGLDRLLHHQGVSIPSSTDYYREYLDRANGRKPSVIGQPYWD